MKEFFLLFLFLLSTPTLKSQHSYNIKLIHYSTSNGLGSTNVRKTIQDENGFTWIATQDGLYRFDGMHFTTYNKSIGGLAGVDVRDILIHDNTLWVVTSYGGINAIDVITGNVTYTCTPSSDPRLEKVLLLSLASIKDTLFIGSDRGLFLLSIPEKKLIKVDVHGLPNTGVTPNIHKLIIDKDNKLWLFCSKGLVYMLNNTTLETIGQLNTGFTRFYDCDRSGNSIVAATNDGVTFFSFENDRIYSFTPYSLQFPAFRETAIYSVRKDKTGDLWFSTKNNLVKLNLNSGEFSYIRSSKLIDGKDWVSTVYGIFFDKKNTLWLSCQEGLGFSIDKPSEFLCYTRSEVSDVVINRSYYLYPDTDTSVLVCAEDGFYKVALSSRTITTLDKNKTYFYAFEDGKRNLIVSNDEGTFVLKQKKLIPFKVVYPEFSEFGLLMLNSHAKMSDTLWIFGTQNRRGIIAWNPLKRKVHTITESSQPLHLLDDNINTIHKDNDDLLWILSDNSVSIFDVKKGEIRHLNIKNPITGNQYTIFFDIRKVNSRYYLASYSNGIVVLDSQYNFIKEISTHDKLSHNGVYKLLPYKDSLLFATSNYGLSSINMRTGEIKSYYETDGLQSNVFEELSGNTRSNNLFAGGMDGFTLINPALLLNVKDTPALFIRNIRIETDRITDTSNLNIKRIAIPNNVKQTIIYFSALNYSNPHRTTFAYKIPELQDDWINLNNQNFIPLIGIKHGVYHLQVRATNEAGINSEIKEIILVFLPKWHQTWWFKSLVVLAALALIYTLYRLRIAQLKKEENIRRRLASDLHDDLGSTLNSIKVFSNLALMEKDNHPYLVKIKESTQDAITGIRDIIWILDDKKDTVEHLLTRVRQFAEHLCEAANTRFEQRIDDDAYQYKLAKEEKRNLYMIIKEAINNSIKYAECSRIELTVSVERKKLRIIIADNGKGFDTSKAPEGNGLKNIAARSKEIHYKYSIESTPGKGTTTRLIKT